MALQRAVPASAGTSVPASNDGNVFLPLQPGQTLLAVTAYITQGTPGVGFGWLQITADAQPTGIGPAENSLIATLDHNIMRSMTRNPGFVPEGAGAEGLEWEGRFVNSNYKTVWVNANLFNPTANALSLILTVWVVPA